MVDLIDGASEYVLSEQFLRGAYVTLLLTVFSQSAGIVLGLVLALLKTARWRVPRHVAGFYVWFFRGTPVLLQLIFVYAALPQYGVRFSAFQSAVIALALNEAAYMAEIIRAGIEAVGRGQRLAARALGMNEWQVMRYVVLPQAARIVVPPTGNQFIGMLKTSALASVIAVQDLLLTAQRVASANFDYVPTLVAAASYYLVLTTIFSVGQGYLERRLSPTRRRRPSGTSIALPQAAQPSEASAQ